LHAFRAFIGEHSDLEQEWHDRSNHIAVLSAKDEDHLHKLIARAKKKGIRYSLFREPDFDNEVTALAIEPGDKGRRFCSSLPLAFKDKRKEASPYEQVVQDMKQTEQTKGQSIYQHGISVWKHYEDLLGILEDKEANYKWRMPSWFVDYKDDIKKSLLPSDIIQQYTTMHDCGKPYCRTVDEGGMVHFPDHAQASYKTWNRINGDITIGQLILRDMEIHIIKAKDIPEFCRDKNIAITLLLAGLAEVHSNAAIFGGVESQSFKIKWRQIDRRGRAICRFLFGDKSEAK